MAETLKWSLGLRASSGKYLTAETFGFKIVATAAAMKKKQIWFLEQNGATNLASFKSHLGRYLSVDGDGNVHADKDDNSDDETSFVIEAQDDGRWAIKSAKYGWYFGGSGENLKAFTKEIVEEKLWTIQLAMHPQIALQNVNRKTFLHLASNGDSMDCDEILPWGSDATVTVVFFDEGLYGLQAINGGFLCADGSLRAVDDSCKYILQFFGGAVAFKNKSNGKYLSAMGATGKAKASKGSVGKDELWVMQDSHPQFKLTAKTNSKKVSTKAGVEVAASQASTEDTEIFQVEPQAGGKWLIKTNKAQYWTCVEGGAILGNAKEVDASCHFDIEWAGNEVAFVASNGKYVGTKANGQLAAKFDAAGSDETNYVWELINRPKLILRGVNGFIGTMASGLLECNKSTVEVYNMHIHQGFCHISSASTGKYWKVNPNGISCTGSEPENYTMTLCENSKMLLAFEGKYFQCAQNGAFTATGTKADASTLLEY